MSTLLLVLLIFGISSCVHSCTSTQQQEGTESQTKQDAEPVNEKDERVAYGVDAELTSKFSQVLDRNDDFAYLAAHADMIEDQRLIDLALAEPEAVSFVAGAVDATGSTQAFGASVPLGEYPKLYTFDKRWGYAPYADGTIGAVGSGPVALSMASMGLTGSTAQDPVAMAAAVSAANVATGVTGMDDAFLLNHANDVGLAAAIAEATSEGIYIPLVENLPVIARVREGSGIGSNLTHWILITQLNDDNSITVHDPTSAIASSHTWSLGAVSAQVESAYQISISYGRDTQGATAGIASGVQPQQGDNTQVTQGDTTDGYAYNDESYGETYTEETYGEGNTDETYTESYSGDENYYDENYSGDTYSEETYTEDYGY